MSTLNSQAFADYMRENGDPECEGPRTLPQTLLNLIGEYGYADRDRVSDVERIHRWELLIDGIKDYARAEVYAEREACCQSIAALIRERHP